jgi:hypothetical protein
VDTNTFLPLTFTGLLASLSLGDGTNFTRTPAIGTNAATYGELPMRIYVQDLQERYKVLSALNARSSFSLSNASCQFSSSLSGLVGAGYTNCADILDIIPSHYEAGALAAAAFTNPTTYFGFRQYGERSQAYFFSQAAVLYASISYYTNIFNPPVVKNELFVTTNIPSITYTNDRQASATKYLLVSSAEGTQSGPADRAWNAFDSGFIEGSNLVFYEIISSSESVKTNVGSHGSLSMPSLRIPTPFFDFPHNENGVLVWGWEATYQTTVISNYGGKCWTVYDFNYCTNKYW